MPCLMQGLMGVTITGVDIYVNVKMTVTGACEIQVHVTCLMFQTVQQVKEMSTKCLMAICIIICQLEKVYINVG